MKCASFPSFYKSINQFISGCLLGLFGLFCLNPLNVCYAEEVFDSEVEALLLKNIRQLTFPSMNFEKAGEGYFSPDAKTIIFQAVPTGEEHYQIFTLSLEEGIPRMVSTGKGACTCAFFKPDGIKIIFASSHSDPDVDLYADVMPHSQKTQTGNYKWDLTPYMNVYEANWDGSELTPLTTGAPYHAECAYSPDGSEIVYASNQDGSMNLFIMKSDGTEHRQITYTDDSYNGGPFFSPDGKRVIFRADRERRDYLQIYVTGADGTGEHELTFNSAVNWAPYWHPNGKVVAFATSLHGHRYYEIYLLNIETGVSHRLTHSACFDGLPVFSPDGTQIMWTSKRGPDNTCQLFIADFEMPVELMNE